MARYTVQKSHQRLNLGVIGATHGPPHSKMSHFAESWSKSKQSKVAWYTLCQ